MRLPCLRDKVWSPYLAGIIIGLLQIPAFLLIQTALGTSSSYVTVGGTAVAPLDPTFAQIEYVAKHIALTAKNWWQVALVVGIMLGAFLSMKLSGAKRQSISPIWKKALPFEGAGKRYALAAFAGFIMIFGARIADGCTSGHGLSGVSQLAVSSLIAVVALFAGGIVVAKLFLRRI